MYCSCLSVCHIAEGNVSPAWYVRKAGRGGSCCSPGCSPSYLSTICHHVSSLFVATLSASCVKKKWVGESLTGIGVDSDDMCCHCLKNMASLFMCQVIFNMCIRTACVNELVTLNFHVIVVESVESATLNSERGCHEEWGYIKFNVGIPQSTRHALSRS